MVEERIEPVKPGKKKPSPPMEKKQPPKKPAIKVKSNVMMVAPRNMDQETQRELLLTEKKAAQLQEELNNLEEQIKKMRQEALNRGPHLIVNTPANTSRVKGKQPKPEKPGEEKNKQKRNRNPGPKKKKPQAQTAPPGKGKQKERETITSGETTTSESTAPENTPESWAAVVKKKGKKEATAFRTGGRKRQTRN